MVCITGLCYRKLQSSAENTLKAPYPTPRTSLPPSPASPLPTPLGGNESNLAKLHGSLFLFASGKKSFPL